ncbi:MAG: zinc-dependent metalloprotease [Planctomycetota bacterium]|jgi:hypothetical protein
MKKRLWVLLALLAAAPVVLAEEDKAEKKKPDFPAWSKIGKDMQMMDGFWKIHQDKKKRKFWIEIPSSMNVPFLLATSVTGGTTLAGHQWNDWFLVWEVHDKKLVLLERNVGVKAKGDKPLQDAVSRTYTDRVLATYNILAKGPKGGWIIDGRNFFASGATLFFGGIGRSKDSSLAKFDGTKNFADNTEVRVTMPSARRGNLITLHYSVSKLKKTGYKPRIADDRIGYFLTTLKDFSADNKDENRNLRYINRWHLVKEKPKLKLSPPKVPIKFYIEKTVPVKYRRYVRDGILEWNKTFEKIGFDGAIEVLQQTDTNEHKDKDPEDVNFNFFRWIYSDMPFAMGPSRVDPRTGEILDADILFDDSYIRFTLQEYALTIKQVPLSATGIRGRELLKKHPLKRLGIVPADDEFFHAIPEDAARPNLGPYARRSFCSIGKGVRHQLACCGLVYDLPGKPEGGETPEKTEEPFPEELIGQFIKDTVMHEVGHTLGLRHNFKASIYRTLEEINSESKPADITASVMDYAPLSIAPEGRPQGNWACTTIGPYDYWAIQYGYTTENKELPKILSRVAEKGLDYATDEDTWSNDPYVNTWDMGSDPLKYAEERVALMKRLRKNLEERAVKKGERYNRLRRAVDMQFYEGANAAWMAMNFVGGEHIHRDHRGDPNARAPLVPVDAAKQREALRFLCDEFLAGRYFDFGPETLRKLAPDFWGDDFWSLFFYGHSYPYQENVLDIQASIVFSLTSPDRLGRVLDTRHKVALGRDLLTAPEIFDAVQGTIFANLKEAVQRKSTNQAPALRDLQRNLQREYVTHLIEILLEGEYWYPAAIQTLARHYVRKLEAQIADAIRVAGEVDTYTLSHLEECQARLERALKASFALTR